MLQINGKTFMNLQEAVQWLLANNALPFQCNVNYVANTEIAKTAIINPSPAEIKVGALVLFADSKVGTVSGLTSNGFMVGPEYTDIQTALAYISNVSVNSGGYLTVTLSDGTVITAGQIREVVNFEIDASQHLIVHYNNSTSDDLGAIFSGNIDISGTLQANEILEKMSGYSFVAPSDANVTYTIDYAGVVKTGNKLTFSISGKIKISSATSYIEMGRFIIPLDVASKLYETLLDGFSALSYKQLYLAKAYNNGVVKPICCSKPYAQQVLFGAYNCSDLELNTDYQFRIEETYLLSENLAS